MIIKTVETKSRQKIDIGVILTLLNVSLYYSIFYFSLSWW